MLTGCLASELNDVILSNCPENFGQIQKLIFWPIYASAGVRNKFEPELAMSPTNPALIANWTALLAATNATKPVQSPYLAEPVSEAGAKRTYGGGNATPGGITFNIGREPQTFEAKMLSVNQAAVKALKTFQVGSGGNGVTSIGVIPVNEAGQMMFDSNGLATTNLDLWPIPVYSLFIGDKTLGGLEAVDHNMISFELKPNWSDNIVIVTPTDFNALEDLVNT